MVVKRWRYIPNLRYFSGQKCLSQLCSHVVWLVSIWLSRLKRKFTGWNSKHAGSVSWAAHMSMRCCFHGLFCESKDSSYEHHTLTLFLPTSSSPANGDGWIHWEGNQTACGHNQTRGHWPWTGCSAERHHVWPCHCKDVVVMREGRAKLHVLAWCRLEEPCLPLATSQRPGSEKGAQEGARNAQSWDPLSPAQLPCSTTSVMPTKGRIRLGFSMGVYYLNSSEKKGK